MGCQTWDSKLSLFREKCVFASFLLTVGHYMGVRFMVRLCLSLSYCFDVGFFLFAWYKRVTQLVFLFVSPRGNCSICSSVFSVFVGGSGFRILLCHHLQPEPVYFYMERYLKCIVKKLFLSNKTVFVIGFCFCEWKNILICKRIEKVWMLGHQTGYLGVWEM